MTQAAATQASAGLTSLSQFYLDLASHLSSTGTPADVDALVAGIEFADLQTFTSTEVGNRPSFKAGAGVEAVSELAGFYREAGLGSMTKLALVAAAISEAQGESVAKKEDSVYLSQVIQGAQSVGVKL